MIHTKESIAKLHETKIEAVKALSPFLKTAAEAFPDVVVPDERKPVKLAEPVPVKISQKEMSSGTKRRKPEKKEQTALRFSPYAMTFFRAYGPGWQVRMQDVLEQFARKHGPDEFDL